MRTVTSPLGAFAGFWGATNGKDLQPLVGPDPEAFGVQPMAAPCKACPKGALSVGGRGDGLSSASPVTKTGLDPPTINPQSIYRTLLHQDTRHEAHTNT